MFTKEIRIQNQTGIHARPATLITKKATQCTSNVTIECKGKKANAKSMISVLSLGVGYNDTIILTVEGEDENVVGPEFAELIENIQD